MLLLGRTISGMLRRKGLAEEEGGGLLLRVVERKDGARSDEIDPMLEMSESSSRFSTLGVPGMETGGGGRGLRSVLSDRLPFSGAVSAGSGAEISDECMAFSMAFFHSGFI